jgi:hypothetical protein
MTGETIEKSEQRVQGRGWRAGRGRAGQGRAASGQARQENQMQRAKKSITYFIARIQHTVISQKHCLAFFAASR